MTKLDDWNKCNDLYCGWMYYEAAERGYDARAASAAQHEYIKARMEYEKSHGMPFNPEAKREDTTILEDAAEFRDVAKAFVASIETNGTEAKRYGQVVRDWLDGCRARTIAKRGSESV